MSKQVGIKMSSELKDQVDNYCLLNGITKTAFWEEAANMVLNPQVVVLPGDEVDTEAETTVIPVKRKIDHGPVGCTFQ